MHKLGEQADYLAQYSTTRASLVVNSVFRQLDMLRPHPQLGHMVPEFGDETIRELLYRQYCVIYRLVSAERIDVLAFQTGLRPLQLPL